MSSTEFKFTTLAEICLLSEDQFGRMLPDFVTWYAFGKQAQKVGAEITGFTWIDDGEPGVIREVGVTDPVTGERMTIVLSGAT